MFYSFYLMPCANPVKHTLSSRACYIGRYRPSFCMWRERVMCRFCLPKRNEW